MSEMLRRLIQEEVAKRLSDYNSRSGGRRQYSSLAEYYEDELVRQYQPGLFDEEGGVPNE